MTTLQTLSSRSSHSAEFRAQSAQTVEHRADDAPGFAGVLEAFSAEPAEPLTEDAQNQDSTENTESEEAEQDPKSKDTTSEATSTESAKGDDPVTTTETVDQPAQTQPGPRPVEQTQPVNNTPIIAQFQTHAIHSAGDLGVLLTNAASIDLAALATKQLEGNAGKPATGAPSADAPLAAAQAQQSKPIPQAISIPNRAGPTPHGADVEFSLPGSTSTSGHGRDGAIPGTTDAALIKSAHQTQSPEAAPPTAQHLTQQTQIQASQTVQAAVPDASISSRRLNGARSIAEIAGVASKAAPTASNTAGTQTGSEQGAMDLGSRSKAATKLHSTQADDRAMQRQQVMSQVQRGLASVMNTKGGSMKLRLTPEHLGEVNIQLTTKDGAVSVQIDAKNDATRTMLQSGLDELRHAMESRGATVNELRVESAEQSPFERLFGQTSQNTDDNRSGSDQNQNESDQHTSDDHPDSENQDHSTPLEPRGIWTDIGLDAIA